MKINFSEILREAFGQKVHYENNNVQKNFEIIKKAIQTGGVVEFYYLNVDGLPRNQYRKRVCEPFDLAINKKDNIILSGWWVAQYSKSGKVPIKWREYLLSNIKQLRIIPRKQRIVRELWAGGTHKNMKKVLVSIADFFKPSNGKSIPQKFRQEKQKQDNAKKVNDKVKYQEPEKEEPTGEFEEDDLTQN